MVDAKKDTVTNPELQKEEENESYTDMFGTWVRDRLKTGKAKMKDVE